MFIPSAHAQAAGAVAADSPYASILSIAPLFLVFIAFYFLMIRPQQKRVKMLQQAVEAVKKGDSVITGGGIAGKVTKVEDRFVEVEIAPAIRVRVVKSTIAEIVVPGAGSAKPAND